MFNKVLVAEDHQTTGKSIKRVVEELSVNVCDYAYHCDDAMTRIRNEKTAGHPYELLITDLSFAPAPTHVLKNGVALITAARQAQPNLKILVFSVENKPVVIQKLFDESKIDGYVSKGLEDELELKSAMETIFAGRKHVPAGLWQTVKKARTFNFTETDLAVIDGIFKGIQQKEMPEYLLQKGLTPPSLSSIEKRLALIKDTYHFSNNTQLVVFCREAGFI